MLRIGSHLSISKGFPQAVAMAQEVGANTFQFFTRNPRGGRARVIGAEEVAQWSALREEYDIRPVAGHLPYTVNMASPVEKAYLFANMVVSQDLARMEAVGAEYLVIHPGSHAGSGREVGLDRIVACLQNAFQGFTGQAVLLLETMAGQGTEIGTLDDMLEIFERLDKTVNLGVCLDSCHLTAAGYDFLASEETERLIDDIERTVGLNRIHAIHLNDSKFPPGSHRDRHERLGKGYLGRTGVINFIGHPAFRGLPLLLETPVDHYLQYREEIDLVSSWLAEAKETEA